MPKEGESPDAYLVRATSSAVAANVAGVSGLCIHHHEQPAGDHYRRNNRNIHHLLHMESGLPKQADPMAGAYAIDHYTAAWATAIWEKLDRE
jgi:methylmalonyl-CoA mutase N-terminal domain/subunit